MPVGYGDLFAFVMLMIWLTSKLPDQFFHESLTNLSFATR